MQVQRNRNIGWIVAVAILFGLGLGVVLVWMLVPMRKAGLSPAAQPGGSDFARQSQNAIVEAVKKVGPAVVSIDTTTPPPPEAIRRNEMMRRYRGEEVQPPQPQEGKASGVIIDGARGDVITNAHVAANATSIKVTLSDGRSYGAKLIALDRFSDVALIRVQGAKQNLPQADLGSPSDLPIGSWVIAIGNPFGLESSVSVGVLSAKERQLESPAGPPLFDMLQTDAAINPGNSGGALVNLNGQVIGMPTVIIPYAQGMGFATSADTIRRGVRQMLASGRVQHPWVGLQYHLTTDAEMVERHLNEHGLLVDVAAPGSPAAQAGIAAKRDVIVQADGRPVQSMNHLGSLIRQREVGQKIRLGLWRNGRMEEVSVTIGERPMQG